MKMRVPGPIRKVRIGPYFEWSLRRWGSRSKKELDSHRRLPKMGTVGGPGGSLDLGKRSLRANGNKKERKIEIRNHDSIKGKG